MLLKRNKLLLFESKEFTQPACLSARQVAWELQLILEHGMQDTHCQYLKGRNDMCKILAFWTMK